MDDKYYTVVNISGEYAYLREDGAEEGDDLFIALALLPLGVDIGTKLIYRFPDFLIV